MLDDIPCVHIDGKRCEKCWPPKSKDTKKAISLFLHLSKVDNKIYIGIDANALDLGDFGINMVEYQQLGNEIQDVFNRIIAKKIDI